jgi:FixJ family two-component response regulator
MAALEKTKMVAIVDDDDLMRSALQGLLKAVGLPAQAFASAEEFLSSGKRHDTACLIADIRMPRMPGLELQAHLNAERCKIPIIFITAHGDEKMRMQELRAGAVEFREKRSTTRLCSRVCGRHWKAKPASRSVHQVAQGGPP